MSQTAAAESQCGCCEGVVAFTPVKRWNPPGLAALKYRVGTYGQFRETMVENLAKKSVLSRLTARDDNDLAIGLLDSWAAVGDVLTFYQERIANEGYLRTATKRLSLLELAREIGYELRPGVAAGAELAFTIDASGAVASTLIDVGTKIQSIPAQGKSPPEMPQTYEIVEPILARPEFNSIMPRQSVVQRLDLNSTSRVLLAGTDTKLKVGDHLLFLAVSGTSRSPMAVATVAGVTLHGDSKTSEVQVANLLRFGGVASGVGQIGQVLMYHGNLVRLEFLRFLNPFLQRRSLSASVTDDLSELGLSAVREIISNISTQSALTAFLSDKGWDPQAFADVVNSFAEDLGEKPTIEVQALRLTAAFFGSTAPDYDSLPSTVRTALGTRNWSDSTVAVNADSAGHSYDGGSTVYLDSTYPAILPGGWIVLQSGSGSAAYCIESVAAKSMADFLVSAKVTGLTLNAHDVEQSPLSGFKLRDTVAHTQSELLTLAEVEDTTSVGSSSVLLDKVYAGLQVGQRILVSGELSNQPGLSASEIVKITDITPFVGSPPVTRINLSPALANSYLPKTLHINANVAPATHGETESGPIGSGDPTQPYLDLALSQKPLTYVSAPTPTGAETTLEVRVDGLLWKEAASLYGLAADSRSYSVRRDDDGTMHVLFGNARPPAGQENITAKYRVGIGTAGLVKAAQLSLLMTKPLGVRGVTNPFDASGAADPEDRDHARVDAPLTVLTLDRIVSLTDVRDFALAFAGIGKALALWTWNGDRRVVRLVIASATGTAVDRSSDLYSSLSDALQRHKDPGLEVNIDPSFALAPFNMHGWLLVKTDYERDRVSAAVTAALRKRFSFDAGELGHPVHLSDVVATIQEVDGVEAADVDQLYLSGLAGQPHDVLTCDVTEILVLNPGSEGISLDVRRESQ